MEISIDTLAMFERLKKAKLDEAVARELSEIFRDNAREIIAHQKEVLATKDDVTSIVMQAKVEIIKWVAGMLVAQAAIVATLVKLL